MKKIILVVCLFLIGCIQSKSDPNVSTVMPTLPPTSDVQQELPSKNALATTPTPMPTTSLSPDCSTPVKDSFPRDFQMSGMIVALDRSAVEDNNYHLLLFDPKNDSAKELFQEHIFTKYAVVSPSRTLIAYTDENNSRIQVRDLSGKIIRSIQWLKDWRYLSGWLDDKHLIIRRTQDTPPSIVILGVDNDEKKLLTQNYADWYMLDPSLDWNGSGIGNYNSTLSEVIYADNAYEYVLLNLKKGAVIAKVPTIKSVTYIAKAPQWSPDGEKVAIAAPLDVSKNTENDELFLIDSDGSMLQLTHLTDIFKQIGITRFSWSPNGRFVSFLYRAPYDFVEERLAIFDLLNKTNTFYCVSGSEASDYHPFFSPRLSILGDILPPPIWSIDGKQLIVENRYKLDASQLILLDIESGLAIKFGKNLLPVGWIDGSK